MQKFERRHKKQNEWAATMATHTAVAAAATAVVVVAAYVHIALLYIHIWNEKELLLYNNRNNKNDDQTKQMDGRTEQNRTEAYAHANTYSTFIVASSIQKPNQRPTSKQTKMQAERDGEAERKKKL